MEEGISYCACERGRGRMPALNTQALLGIFALTKDGSQKKIKDTGELAKTAETNTP